MATPEEPESFAVASADEFLDRMLGDAGLCLEIVDLGLRESRETAASVVALRRDAALEDARRALHSLRGSAVIFGATAYAELLRGWETSCAEGRREEILAGLADFERAQDRFERALLDLAAELRARA